eukprot:11273833-Prorocentrum_lima.AAC.1
MWRWSLSWPWARRLSSTVRFCGSPFPLPPPGSKARGCHRQPANGHGPHGASPDALRVAWREWVAE